MKMILSGKKVIPKETLRLWSDTITKCMVSQIDEGKEKVSPEVVQAWEFAAGVLQSRAGRDLELFAPTPDSVEVAGPDLIRAIKLGLKVYEETEEKCYDIKAPLYDKSKFEDGRSKYKDILRNLATLIYLKSPKRVLDAGCGKGFESNVLAKLFPDTEFVSLDLSKSSAMCGTILANDMGVKNVEFFSGSLMEQNPELGTFDFIYSIYGSPGLKDYTQEAFPGLNEINLALLYKVLEGMKSHLKPNGTITIVEDTSDISSFYRVSEIPSKTISKVRIAKKTDEFMMYLHKVVATQVKQGRITRFVNMVRRIDPSIKYTVLTDFVSMLRADGFEPDSDFSRMIRLKDGTALVISTLNDTKDYSKSKKK